MLRRSHDHHRALQARRNTAPSTNSPNGLNQNQHLMSASTPHVGAFACSLCWSSAPIMLAHRLKQSSQICKKSAQPTSRSHSRDRQRRSALPSTAARTPYHLTGGAQIPIAQAVPLQSFSRGFLPWKFSNASRQYKSHVVSCGWHPKTFPVGDIVSRFCEFSRHHIS